ncbi:MAG: hypothetical protein OFPII_03850 [Osedax symbiont Rs1]|nr:MAG: hypothetical protein OFPII_03850 [Osedax symbiont Rs1]
MQWLAIKTRYIQCKPLITRPVLQYSGIRGEQSCRHRHPFTSTATSEFDDRFL